MREKNSQRGKQSLTYVSAKETVNDLETTGLTVSTKTIARTLHGADFGGYRPRKTPLLKPRHLKARLAFVKRHLEHDNEHWKSIHWSDETKIKLFGHMDSRYVWMNAGEPFHPNNIPPQLNLLVGALCFGVALSLLVQENLFEFMAS